MRLGLLPCEATFRKTIGANGYIFKGKPIKKDMTLRDILAPHGGASSTTATIPCRRPSLVEGCSQAVCLRSAASTVRKTFRPSHEDAVHFDTLLALRGTSHSLRFGHGLLRITCVDQGCFSYRCALSNGGRTAAFQARPGGGMWRRIAYPLPSRRVRGWLSMCAASRASAQLSGRADCVWLWAPVVARG